ncbi:MAG TPA: UDP-N-acetylmuramoyl-tripeptide--D-alanyl-D-alanine ligase [Bryobacteraceae bacterium]|jgi:UDP-N-acetylmuramoyl-tripeptide--D-alanyl-D-alanine ligase
MTVDLEQAARVMNASGAPQPVKVAGWSVDTRTQNAGDVFFALRGPNFDGHDFVPPALAKGASAVVVERSSGADRELVVSDSLIALQRLASWARDQWSGRVIGVTGSAGKTTTKDAIAHLLSGEFAVGKTVGNLNNHVGVPLSILRLPDESRVGVLEMGMNHAGEIRTLAEIARPEIGVVTNVGYAHVEAFDSIEGVAAAKRELIEGLPRDGVAVLNGDDPRVCQFRDVHPGPSVTFGFSECAEVRAEALALNGEVTRFRVGGEEFETTLAGRHGIMNLLAAIAVARVLGIAPAKLTGAVRSFTAGKMRGERMDWNGIAIWNDCYNSNPEAARAMLDVLSQTPAERRIAVLGEMLELGHASEELHRQVGRYAAEKGIDFLIGVRGFARAMINAAVGAGIPESAAIFFEDAGEAGAALREMARPGDAILLKGSRGVRVERVLERLLA